MADPVQELFMSAARHAAIAASLVLLPAAAFGGWSVISVHDLPDYATAGRPVSLGFTIRQHGMQRQTGLKPTVTVQSGGEAVTVPAEAGPKAGDYRASITLATAGEWSVGINSGFGKSRLALLPVTAVAPGATAPLSSVASRGKRLFVAKGCVTCHLHPEVTGSGNESIPAGPPLGVRKVAADTLATILAMGVDRGTGNRMPDLELKPAEIASLTTFLNGSQQAGTR
jgi:hypothetical protein